MSLRARCPALAGAVCVTSLALAACSPATSPEPVTSPKGTTSPKLTTPGTSQSARYAGYDWLVVAISHGGKITSVPARLGVDLRFSRSGRFGGDDPVNFHDGSFRVTRDGFTTGPLGVTGAGYAGHDRVVLLAISAMTAFDNGARAKVTLTGDRLVVSVASYTLTCQRHGPAHNV